MDDYIGLDVSMKETAISIRREGARVWRGKCNSGPARIAQIVWKRAPNVERVVCETGPLSVWFYHAPKEERACQLYSQAKLSAVARQLNERPRKTLGYETPQSVSMHVLRRSIEITPRLRYSDNCS